MVPLQSLSTVVVLNSGPIYSGPLYTGPLYSDLFYNGVL